jgi:ATP-binding protein involved in chromosome partitioning
MAEQGRRPSGLGVPFLGEVPLDRTCACAPTRASLSAPLPDSRHAAIYRDIARQVWATLEGGNLQKPAPKISFE